MVFEQLRIDCESVADGEGHDVYGMAAVANQRLIRDQYWNTTWHGGWIIPDAWDDVKPISLNHKEPS